MSIAAVRPFFRTRLNGLGYKEHVDAFDDTNREQKKLEKLYRIEVSSITGTGADQTVHTFDVDVDLVVTLRGKGNKNVELADRALEVFEEINGDILQEDVRVGTVIKNVTPSSSAIAPYSGTDDNDLTLTVGFTCEIICEF